MLVFALAVAGSIVVGTVATAIEVLAPPHYEIMIGSPEELSAASWIVFDTETGEVFASKEEDTQLPIASVTKLGTAAVLYADNRLFATTTVTWDDLAAEGRAGRLKAYKEYDVHTLLFPLLLESSNDAATTLARSESSLVLEMNEFAAGLGLLHTVFADTSGLADGNVSTAAELAVLVAEIYTNRRHILDITSLPSYLTEEDGWLNNNPYIATPEYLGGKHGFTDAAGHTAVAVFRESFEAGERPVGYVLLKSSDLSGDMEALRAYVREYVVYR